MTESQLNSDAFEDILYNLNQIFENIKKAKEVSNRENEEVKLMAVTKTVSVDKINFAIENGVTLIGENKAQELVDKFPLLKKDNLEIHFIGTLQTNKVKYIIDKVSMIHSVNSLKLGMEIDKQAAKIGKTMDILIEVNVADELSKSGIEFLKVTELIVNISTLNNVKIRGLMTIPPISENDATTRKYFSLLKKLYIDIEAKKIDNVSMEFLSMGMSSDYIQAIYEGSNIIRVGTSLFGKRNYVI